MRSSDNFSHSDKFGDSAIRYKLGHSAIMNQYILFCEIGTCEQFLFDEFTFEFYICSSVEEKAMSS